VNEVLLHTIWAYSLGSLFALSLRQRKAIPLSVSKGGNNRFI